MRQPDDFPDEELPEELPEVLPEALFEDEANDALVLTPLEWQVDGDADEVEDEPFDGEGTEADIETAAAVMTGTVAVELTLTVTAQTVTAQTVTAQTVTEQAVTEQAVTEAAVAEVNAVALSAVESAWEVSRTAPRPVVPPWVRKAYADKLLAFSSAPSYADYVARSQRLGRLLHSRYAETRLTPAAQQAASAFPETLNILAVIAEEDPDTIAVLPIVARLVDVSPRLQLRVLSDEGDLFALSVLAPELDLNVLLEEWDLPQFLLFDEEWELQAQWGPRPSAAEPQVEAWLAAHPEYEALAEDESAAGQERYAALTQRLMYEMRVWYNSSLAKSCLEEWQVLLTAWQNGEDAGIEAGVEGEA